MNKLKKMAAGAAVGIAAVGGMVLGASPAQAVEGVDMNVACQVTHGTTAWVAYLADSSNVYGWRCKNRGTGATGGVNVNAYCQAIYGTNSFYLDYYNPYSWRCN